MSDIRGAVHYIKFQMHTMVLPAPKLGKSVTWYSKNSSKRNMHDPIERSTITGRNYATKVQ